MNIPACAGGHVGIAASGSWGPPAGQAGPQGDCRSPPDVPHVGELLRGLVRGPGLWEHAEGSTWSQAPAGVCC